MLVSWNLITIPEIYFWLKSDFGSFLWSTFHSFNLSHTHKNEKVSLIFPSTVLRDVFWLNIYKYLKKKKYSQCILYTFTIKKPAIHISFFSLGSSSYLKKQYIIQLLKMLPKSNENILLLFTLVDFVGLIFFSFPPIPTMDTRHTKYVITWESHTAFKGAIQVNCVNNMPLKTLTYEYRFTSYEVVIYLRDKNMHLKKNSAQLWTYQRD